MSAANSEKQFHMFLTLTISNMPKNYTSMAECQKCYEMSRTNVHCNELQVKEDDGPLDLTFSTLWLHGQHGQVDAYGGTQSV